MLADQAGREAPALESVLSALGYDGEGVLVVGDSDPEASTQMVCGHYSFRGGADHPLLRALPDHVVVTQSTRVREPWLDEMLRLVARRGLLGYDRIHRIGDAALRDHLHRALARRHRAEPALQSVLEGFRDRQIGGALELMHRRPEQPWTVETLAGEVGMSRSRFAERFRDLLGVGPMSYLANWRLQRALALLDDTRASVQEVARRTGYRSPAAFSRAFVGKFGVAPSDYRRAGA